MKMLLLTSH